MLTRQPNWGAEYDNSVVIKANSIKAARSSQIVGRGVKDVWVIGGGQVYAQFLSIASRVEITEIHEEYAGDTLAPVLGHEWEEIRRIKNVSSSGIEFDFVSFRNNKTVGQASLIF